MHRERMCQNMVRTSYCQRGFLGLLLFALTTTSTLAMPLDKEELLLFHAQSADINQQTHHGLYVGDVQLDQGTTHLRAAEATTQGNATNQITKAIIKGNLDTQAHYWTLTAIDKPPLHAYADTICYYPVRHFIELIGHARVEQGDNSFAADKISYDTLSQHVVSKSDGKALTTIIIHPEKHT